MELQEWRRRVLRDVLAPSAVLGEPRRVQLYRLAGLAIGGRTRLESGVRFFEGEVRIGSDCYVNTGCLFDPGGARILVEDGVSIGAYSVLAAATHGLEPPERRALTNMSEDIVVGAGSWLGARVTVLSGVRIGRGCVVGDGAVVTKDTADNGLYVGVPTRRVRQLP